MAHFRDILGDPPVLQPDDRLGARQQIDRINKALEGADLTKAQRKRLYKMKTKWTRRAQGMDEWYKAHGNQGSPAKDSNRCD